MDEGFASPTNIAWNGHTGVVEYGGGDKGMVCMFYNRAVHSPAKSQHEGRPVYEDQIYVRIHPPGERLNIVDRQARDDDKRRWPAQWAQYSQKKQQQPDGTPIDLLYPEYPSVAAMLRAAGVSTIEQCAVLSADAITNVGMGCQRYVNQAQKYLDSSGKGAGFTQLSHQLEEKNREIKVLNQKVDSLMNEIENLRAGVQQNPDMGQLQLALAQIMNRPVQMPARPFDAQAAMINATSPTSQITQATQNTRRRVRVKAS